MSIQRRDVLKGAATLPLAAVLADPLIARAVAQQLDTVTIKTPSGRNVSAAIALPQAQKAPTLLLVHEWWGLNDQIKAVAADYAKQGYVALAIDLYDGKVAKMGDAGAAQRYMRQMMSNPKAGFETCAAWVDWLKQYDRGTGKVGTVGWCFGGAWSLNASIARPVDATVIYYGNVNRSVAQLKQLKGPVMGHFGTQDSYINKKMVDGFVAKMKAAGKADDLTVYWYDANHAFANPSGNRFNEAASKLAWQRTADFFKKNLA
jgi:carboxymethylenebutenolidase